jgi:hypothetical protein
MANIIRTIMNLMDEKEGEVKNQNFESASKVRDRIDFLKIRADVCYNACANIKNPEFLPALLAVLQSYLDNRRSDGVDPAVTSLQLAEMTVLLQKMRD